MSNPDEMRRKLEALEAEVTNDVPRQSTQNMASGQKTNSLKSLQAAFEGLPPVAKVAAIAVGLVLGLSILSMVLKLVVSVIIVAGLGVGGYVAYKLLLAEDS